MKIVVCMKQIRQVYARTGLEPDSNYLETIDQVYRINPYDESALNLASRLKRSMPTGQVEIILLTLGELIAERDLRRCLALGADHLYRIHIDSETEPDCSSKAVLLARACRELGADLVLCGRESLDRQNGQVGAYIAHQLQRPFISSGIEIATVESGKLLIVTRRAEKGVREVWECLLPAVVSVDRIAEQSGLPGLESQRFADGYRIRSLFYQGTLPHPRVRTTRIFAPNPRTQQIAAPDSKIDAFERIDQLLAGSRVAKSGRMLDGEVSEQADQIVQYLLEHGFIAASQST